MAVPQGSSNGDLVAILYGDTSSNYSDAGPDTISTNLATFDPFGLPYQSSLQQLPMLGPTGTQLDDDVSGQRFSERRAAIIAGEHQRRANRRDRFFTTEDSGGNATVDQFTFNEGTAGLNGPLTINSPTALETGLVGPRPEFFTSFTNNTTNGLFNNIGAAGASYGLAWAQYSSGTLTADFQIFAPDGTAEFANPIQIFNVSGLASENAAPAWFFRNAGSNSNPASFASGSISGTTLTVSGAVTGTIAVGQTITGLGVASNTTITGFLAGTNGGGHL